MSSAETSKKRMSEDQAPLPLTVTIEDPNTGVIVTLKSNFFVGAYTYRENVSEDSVGVGQIMRGAANTLEQVAVVKALQEKIVPQLLGRIDESTRGILKEAGEPSFKRDIILAALLTGALFPDD